MLVRFTEFEFHVKLVTDVLARLCWCTIQAVLVPGYPRFVKLVFVRVCAVAAISFVSPVTWV